VSTRKSCVTCQLDLVVVCGSFVFEAQEKIGSYVETIEKTALYFPASLKGGRVERWHCVQVVMPSLVSLEIFRGHAVSPLTLYVFFQFQVLSGCWFGVVGCTTALSGCTKLEGVCWRRVLR